MDLKFTVITACFNAGEAIKRTIESVLNQTYSPMEYLIYDGCSKDNTVEIAKQYVEKFADKGIIYSIVSEIDTGVFNAINKGVRDAKGEFISIIAAGDWYELDALENVNTFYNEDSFDLTYGGIHFITPNGKTVCKMSKYDKHFITSRHWNHPSMFLKTDLQKEYGFDEDYPLLADFDLYLKLRRRKVKIRVIDKVIANFPAGGGISTDTGIKPILERSKEKYRVYRKNGYSRLYWVESYGWNLIKGLYLKMNDGK